MGVNRPEGCDSSELRHAGSIEKRDPGPLTGACSAWQYIDLEARVYQSLVGMSERVDSLCDFLHM